MSERASSALAGARLWWGPLLLLIVIMSVATPAAAQTVEISLAEPAAPTDQDTLLQAVVETAVAAPVQLRILRMTLQPGARSPWHAHPGLEFGVVEQGTLRVQVDGLAVLRPADAAADAESQTLPENLDISLSEGDRIAYAPGTNMTFENPGTAPTVLLAATVFPTNAEPATYPHGEPAAADLTGIESVVLGQAQVPQVTAGSVIVFERLAVEAGQNVPAFPGPVLLSLEAGAVAGTVQAATAPGDSTVSEADEVDFSLGTGQAAFFSSGMSQAPLGGGGNIELLRLGILPGAAPATATPDVTVTSVPGDELAGAPDEAATTGTTAPTTSVATIGPPAQATDQAATDDATAAPAATAQAASNGRPLFETPAVEATMEAAAPTQRPLRTITQVETPAPEPTSAALEEADTTAAAPAADAQPEADENTAGDAVDDGDASLYPPVGTLLVVNDSDVRIRAEPGTNGQILGGLTTGQVVVVLDLPTAADGYIWYPVQVADDPNLTGWVAAEFLNVAGQ